MERQAGPQRLFPRLLRPHIGLMPGIKFTHLPLAADVFYANTIGVEPYGYMRTAAGASRDY